MMVTMRATLTAATILAVLVLLGVSGCVNTDTAHFTDSDFVGYHIKQVVVRVPLRNLGAEQFLEQQIVQEFNHHKNVSKVVSAVSFISLFSPTRDWTDAEIATQLDTSGFDTILVVNLLGSQTSETVVGYTTTGTTNSNILTNTTGTTNSNTQTTPIIKATRVTSIRSTLYEVKTGKKIWVADSTISASGAYDMSDQQQVDSYIGNLMSTLKKDGHL